MKALHLYVLIWYPEPRTLEHYAWQPFITPKVLQVNSSLLSLLLYSYSSERRADTCWPRFTHSGYKLLRKRHQRMYSSIYHLCKRAWLMLSFIAKDDIDYVQCVTSGSEWTDYWDLFLFWCSFKYVKLLMTTEGCSFWKRWNSSWFLAQSGFVIF